MLDIGGNLKELLLTIILCTSAIFILDGIESCVVLNTELYLGAGCRKDVVLGSKGTSWICPGKELTSE